MKEIEKINTWIDGELSITDNDGYEYLCEDTTNIEKAIIRHINIERDSEEFLQNNAYSFELLNEIDTEYCVEILNQVIEIKQRLSLEFTEII